MLGQPFSGNVALWSLSYEVWFYIRAGAGLMLVGRQGPAARIGPLLGVVLAWLVFVHLEAMYLFAWLTGVACWFIGRSRRPWLFWFLAVSLSAVGLVLMQLTSQSAQVDLKGFRFIDRSFAVVTFALGLGLLVSAFAHLEARTPFWQRITSWGTEASKFSYSLYLFHTPVIILLQHVPIFERYTTLNLRTFVIYLACAAVLLGSAYLFYFVFERRTPQVRDWLYQWLLARPQPGLDTRREPLSHH